MVLTKTNIYGEVLDRNGYAPSIISGHNEHKCYICQRNGSQDKLDRHEMIHGAYRDKSKSLGLWVYLCHFSCHQFGKYAAHNNIETDLMLKRDAQIAAMDYYGMSVEEFVEEFGKDYL